ncbi:hypothetical protein [Sphingomonas kyungheensis]|uniref:Uncharacterized protein n=1 Tax=Sphingomonas kyungheensis TaxID=1069987 RepID=A0ABU8H7J5_9SPHN
MRRLILARYAKPIGENYQPSSLPIGPTAHLRAFRHLARGLQYHLHRPGTVPRRYSKGIRIMFARFESTQRSVVSVVAAFAFAMIAISAAVPVMPIA